MPSRANVPNNMGLIEYIIVGALSLPVDMAIISSLEALEGRDSTRMIISHNSVLWALCARPTPSYTSHTRPA